MEFKYKLDTDFLELAKNKITTLSATISHNGDLLALFGKDRVIRVYVFTTGKLYRKFFETLEKYAEWQQQPAAGAGDRKKDSILALDKMEYERRFAIEKELDKSIEHVSPPNVQFSDSDQYVFWSSYLGIKVVNLDRGEVLLFW